MIKKGKIKTIKNFKIPQLERRRTLRIYLPPDYEKSNKRYPVFYMQDGQNLYKNKDAAYGVSWKVGEALDRLIHEDKCKEIIVVGIDNGEDKRFFEYSIWNTDEMTYKGKTIKMPFTVGGEGSAYIDFTVNTLKPYIDENFRTMPDRENTAIGGSSMGGLISLLTGLAHQDKFSKVATISTALFFCIEDIEKYIKTQGYREEMKIYMDLGTEETSDSSVEVFPKIYLESNEMLFNFLRNNGFENIKYQICQGAVHHESEWAKRFPDIVQWLFKD